VREHYQERFEFVLVDEYQDTNQIQSDLVDLLAARHHHVTAVGDDSQSIYSWRGANFQNILRFPERHPGATVYRIETNYRSTPEILELANAAIAGNVHQYEKRLTPIRPSGSRPALVVCADAHVQAAFVAQRVLELHEAGTKLDDIAVLYRSHFHALELQMELTRRNLPFSITSGIRFFEQAHVKDVAAYLKLVCNPRDELAFKRLVRMLPGVGPKAADKLWTALTPLLPAVPVVTPAAEAELPDDAGDAGDAGAPSATAVADAWDPEGAGGEPAGAAGGTSGPVADGGVVPAPPVLAVALQGIAEQVPRKTRTDWAQFTATVAQLEAAPTRQDPAAMITLVLEAVYEDYAKATFSNAANRLEDLEQLAAFARQFPAPEEFLAQLALLTNVEAEAESSRAADDERLRLSTIHQAKGLEYGVVFVIMLCDGLFPSARSVEDPAGEEEERRLFYVAVTRARDELYLSYPLVRTAGYTASGDMFQQPSRFLQELPRPLLEEWNLLPPGGCA
jgi:DNA helicase-2/ATP-dependent DNA helicase PcrA